MQRVMIELFTEQSNNAILRLPEREFPGVLVAGDTLSTLANSANEVAQMAMGSSSSELAAEAAHLAERLSDMLERYEAALGANGIRLPYSKE